MSDLIAETDRFDRLKVIELRYFGGSGCTYFLVDRCGRPQRTMFNIFTDESFARTTICYESI